PGRSPVLVDGGADVEARGQDLLTVAGTCQAGADEPGACLLRRQLRREEDVFAAEGRVEDRSGAGSHFAGAPRWLPGSIRCRDDILGKFLHVLSVSSCTAARGCPPRPSGRRRFHLPRAKAVVAAADGASGAEAGGGALGTDAVLRRGV